MAALISVILFCLVANCVMPSLLWRVSSGGWLYFGFFCSGGLVAQLAVLATWAALGVGPMTWRLSICALGAILVGASFVLGLAMPDGTPPASVGIFLMCTAVCGYLLGFGALFLLSRLSRERIVHVDHDSKPGAQSVSIGYLIVATALVAIGISIIKYVLTVLSDQSDVPDANVLVRVSVAVTQYATFSILLLVSCLPLTLRKEFSWSNCLWPILTLALLLPSNLVLLHQYQSLRYEEVCSAIAYSLGYLSASIVFLLMVRQFGFRLARVG